MAIFWIQQYIALPVIVEDCIGMGDEFSQQQPLPRDPSRQNPFAPMIVHPGHTQLANLGAHRQHHANHQQYRNPNAFDMSTMNSALLDIQGRPLPQQYGTNTNVQQFVYQQPQSGHFTGQPASMYNPMFAQPYPYQTMTNNPIAHSTARHVLYNSNPQSISVTHSLPNHNFPVTQPFSYQIHPALQTQQNSYMNLQHAGQYTGGHTPRDGSNVQYSNLYPERSLDQSLGGGRHHSAQTGIIRRTSSNSSFQASLLRGPPRKPKQSGYALWVGNLPPGTHIIDLKDHFARDATTDIESVFLISKSNCAFVNYKTESSCAAAMTRFHDLRFQGVRLVCRLRKGNANQLGRNPSSRTPGESSGEEGGAGDETIDVSGSNEVSEQKETSEPLKNSTKKVAEKYFVIKSLTLEDMERSVLNGIWATQSHNEEVFNRAYHTAENVYLIFSANKSGEYFGYARMASPIDDEAAADLEYPVRPVAPEPHPSDLPITILTPATATAPEGHIIDDSTRGTIFWEAHVEKKDEEQGQTSDDNEEGDPERSGDAIASTELGTESGAEPSTAQQSPQTTFGKPFRVVWLSTERLPFYRTRGLRNPWNSNREVKIARDGTEIEPSVGRRLTTMFHRPAAQPSSASSGGVNPMMYGQTGLPQIPHGWPQQSQHQQQQQQPQPLAYQYPTPSTPQQQQHHHHQG